MSDPETFTDFYFRLSDGSPSVTERVDREYRQRLCSLVQKEMGQRFARREDSEDVVQSVLRSFFRGFDSKGWHIDSSGELWALLVTIARHKIGKHVEYHRQQKRDPSKEVHPEQYLHRVREPHPEDASTIADLCEKTLEGLEPPAPEIFRLKLEGFTREEIAERVGRTESAVRCVIDRFRDRLRRLLSDDCPN